MSTPEKLGPLGERIISEEQAPANADELLKIRLYRDWKIAEALKNYLGAAEVTRIEKMDDSDLLKEMESNILPFEPKTETKKTRIKPKAA